MTFYTKQFVIRCENTKLRPFFVKWYYPSIQVHISTPSASPFYEIYSCFVPFSVNEVCLRHLSLNCIEVICYVLVTFSWGKKAIFKVISLNYTRRHLSFQMKAVNDISLLFIRLFQLYLCLIHIYFSPIQLKTLTIQIWEMWIEECAFSQVVEILESILLLSSLNLKHP